MQNIQKSVLLGTVSTSILHGISLSIESGEMVAIMGASGSGKSTLMNIIGLLDRPSKGHYHLQGKEVSRLDDDHLADLRNQTIGFVFQQFFLLPKFTAIDNVALPLTYRDLPHEVIQARSKELLRRVGMQERLHHRPNQLSGGQQQRVAIARALVSEPELILADEPTGALDSKTGDEVMALFKELHREKACTIVIVTHDPDIGKQCERIITLHDGLIV